MQPGGAVLAAERGELRLGLYRAKGRALEAVRGVGGRGAKGEPQRGRAVVRGVVVRGGASPGDGLVRRHRPAVAGQDQNVPSAGPGGCLLGLCHGGLRSARPVPSRRKRGRLEDVHLQRQGHGHDGVGLCKGARLGADPLPSRRGRGGQEDGVVFGRRRGLDRLRLWQDARLPPGPFRGGGCRGGFEDAKLFKFRVGQPGAGLRQAGLPRASVVRRRRRGGGGRGIRHGAADRRRVGLCGHGRRGLGQGAGALRRLGRRRGQKGRRTEFARPEHHPLRLRHRGHRRPGVVRRRGRRGGLENARVRARFIQEVQEGGPLEAAPGGSPPQNGAAPARPGASSARPRRIFKGGLRLRRRDSGGDAEARLSGPQHAGLGARL
mmetsp:Transcript_1868/g.5580  ORF Transcript_1868/g.5580 Transcript_1868/m.5580 type:complete len:378 (-) Transcript_1868:1589-2722(-)